MRCVKLLFVVALALASSYGYAQQGQPEEPFLQRDVTKSVHIYPNPAVAAEYITVRNTEIPAERMRVTLHNIIGNKMEVETEMGEDPHELRVRIKDLASGYYLVSVKDDKTRSFGIYKLLKR
jgi:hypothetical protein